MSARFAAIAIVLGLAACTPATVRPYVAQPPPRLTDPSADSRCFPGATPEECPGPWNAP